MFPRSAAPTSSQTVHHNVSETTKVYRTRYVALLFVSLSALFSVACAGRMQGLQNPTPLSITPVAASVASGAQIQFAASVSGTSPAAVTWVASAGSITSSGVFTAPSVSLDTDVTVTAISVTNPSMEKSVSIQVIPQGKVSITLTPSTTSIASGAQVQFTATVRGTTDTAVTWTASAGSITSSGLLTAPSVQSNTNITVDASSVASSSAKAFATVLVTASTSPQVVVTVTPATTSVTSGASTQFKATVSGTSNQNVAWSATLGSIDNNGNYIAPTVSSATFDSISATSVSSPTNYGTASVTVNPLSQRTAVEYWVSPSGGDSNDGSQNHPWATIAHADSTLTVGSGGTIVHVLPGTYTPGNFTTSHSGTASARIQFVSDQKWAAKITGSNWNVAGSYVDINGFEIGPNSGHGGDAIGINANYVHVLNNYVHNLGDNQTVCGADGLITVFSSYHDAIIDSNVAYSIGNRTETCSFQAHGLYMAGYHNTITNNIVSKAEGYGIELYHNACQDAVANNTSFYNYTGGIQIASGAADGKAPCVSSGDAYTSVTNNLVVHNGWSCNINSTHHNGGMFFGMSGLGSGNRAHNNLMAGNLSQSCGAADTIEVYSGQPSPAQDGNIDGGSSYTSLFVNYHDEYTGNPADYQLSSSGAAAGAGVPTSATVCAVSPGVSPCVPAINFDGIPWQNSMGPDIGVF